VQQAGQLQTSVNHHAGSDRGTTILLMKTSPSASIENKKVGNIHSI
jgi:hypothetical protein